MKNIKNIVVISVFFLVIGYFSISSVFEKDRDSSDVENRTLAQRPKMSFMKVATGQYFEEFDKYISDQFYGRDSWVRNYIKMNKDVLKKSKVNGLVMGKDGYLLSFNPYKNLQQQKEQSLPYININANNINELNKFIMEKNKKFYFMGVPTQSIYCWDKYPSYLNNLKEKQMFAEEAFFGKLDKNVNAINMRTYFENSNEENLYYKTDHHWNMNGAYIGYNTLMNKIKLDFNCISDPYEKSDYEVKRIDGFNGGYNRQMFWLHNTEDKMELWYPKYDIPSYKKYVDGKADNKLYYIELVHGKNSYSTYMNGDNGEVIFETNRPYLPNALIFGDSFTNPIEPFVSQHFNTTKILDLRHYKTMNLYQYIDNYNPDVVIMVVNTLDIDGAGGNMSFK